jgi:hypothetical protein
VPELAALLRDEWNASLEREGVPQVDLSGEVCPACGCAQPLVGGACADCGLVLE